MSYHDNRERRYVYCPGINPHTGMPCRAPLGEFLPFGQVQSLPGVRVASLSTGGFKLCCSHCQDGYVWESATDVPTEKVAYLLDVARKNGYAFVRFNSDRKYRGMRRRQREALAAKGPSHLDPPAVTRGPVITSTFLDEKPRAFAWDKDRFPVFGGGTVDDDAPERYERD